MKHKYALEFDVCGVPVELPVEYEYDYQPAEQAEANGYPGCDASVVVTGCWLSGCQVMERLGSDQLARLHWQAMLGEGLV